MSDIQCPRCGQTVALADANESVVMAAARNHDRFCKQRQPRGTTMSSPTVTIPKRPHPRELVAHEDPRISRAAKKVLDAVAALDREWEANAAKAELRAEQRRLEAQLAKVKAAINRGAAAPAAPPRDWKAVRDWAAANGIDCPATGKVPGAVVEAYDAAR